jgi:ribonuclease-3
MAELPTRAQIETIIGSRVYDLGIYQQAFVHKSASRYHGGVSQERLELLGDSVLTFVVVELLLDMFPLSQEGEITKQKIKLVNGNTLSEIARKMHLSDLIVTSSNARASGVVERARILEDTLEALIGAIYQDRGMNVVREFIVNILNEHSDLANIEEDNNYKDVLMKHAQKHYQQIPVYNTETDPSPVHARLFRCCVRVGSQVGQGFGTSKKRAEMAAARDAIQNYRATAEAPEEDAAAAIITSTTMASTAKTQTTGLESQGRQSQTFLRVIKSSTGLLQTDVLVPLAGQLAPGLGLRSQHNKLPRQCPLPSQYAPSGCNAAQTPVVPHQQSARASHPDLVRFAQSVPLDTSPIPPTNTTSSVTTRNASRGAST